MATSPITPWQIDGETVETVTDLATSCEELTHWKRLWCWEGLWAGGEGDDRGWDGKMASPTRWTWVWVNSGSWWWTGRPGVLRFMGSQRIGHDWETDLIWSDLKITADGDCSHEMKRRLLLRRKAMTNLDSILKTRNIILPTKVHLIKALVFLVVMCGCESCVDYKESWVPKNWCFWTVVLEKTPESPLDWKKIEPVNPKEISFEYSMEELTHWKRPWCCEGLRAEVKGMKEDEMPSWHHRFSGCEFEQTSGNSEGQGRLACCSSWGWKESDTTNHLSNNNTA